MYKDQQLKIYQTLKEYNSYNFSEGKKRSTLFIGSYLHKWNSTVLTQKVEVTCTPVSLI